MIPSLIIVCALVVVGVILYTHHRLTGSDSTTESSPTEADTPIAAPAEADVTAPDTAPEVCCGMHEVCEKFPDPSAKPVYYDDEELDVFAGRGADSYDDAETEQFRDVLLTLLPGDVAGWWASIRQRGIELPATLNDELMLRLSEGS